MKQTQNISKLSKKERYKFGSLKNCFYLCIEQIEMNIKERKKTKWAIATVIFGLIAVFGYFLWEYFFLIGSIGSLFCFFVGDAFDIDNII